MADNSKRALRYILYRLLRSDKAISSIQDLCDAIGGVSIETIYRWTNGLASPSVEQLVQICDALNTIEPLDVLARKLGCRVARIQAKSEKVNCNTLTVEALELSAHLADIHERTLKAVADGKISHHELRELSGAWAGLESIATENRAAIDNQLAEEA